MDEVLLLVLVLRAKSWRRKFTTIVLYWQERKSNLHRRWCGTRAQRNQSFLCSFLVFDSLLQSTIASMISCRRFYPLAKSWRWCNILNQLYHICSLLTVEKTNFTEDYTEIGHNGMIISSSCVLLQLESIILILCCKKSANCKLAAAKKRRNK